jgi:chromosome segregation protein
VRRRDVQDVFLGTGLGPRAYAIIGQGTISRIIESKPEELRLFLEEAAGVSKYKERRRETENRLKDTRENLTRVETSCASSTQPREARVAGRGRKHVPPPGDEQHAEAAPALVPQAPRRGQGRRARQARGRGSTTPCKRGWPSCARSRRELETVRQAHYGAGDALHSAQGALAEAALEVSRLEERIRYVVEGRQRVQQRMAELDAQNAQWSQRRQADEAEVARLAEQIVAAEGLAADQATQVERQSATLPALEDRVREAASDADAQRQAVSAVQQQIQVLAADTRNLQEQINALKARRERLVAETAGLSAPDEHKLAELQRQKPMLDERYRAPRRGCTSCRSRCRSSTSAGARNTTK